MKSISYEHETPRIFISYSWESEENKIWVKEFTDLLTSRNIEIFLDQSFEQSCIQLGNTARFFGELIGRISCCHIFMPIITTKYLEKIGFVNGQPVSLSGHGWVYEEYQQALKLLNQKHIEIISIFREGDKQCLPPFMNLDDSLDFRSKHDFNKKLEVLVNYIHNKRLVKDKENIEGALRGFFRNR